jgi:hypothetical protein
MMTAAAELVARLRARGVTLEAEPPDLVVRPADAVTADEVESLRRHKQRSSLPCVGTTRSPSTGTFSAASGS